MKCIKAVHSKVRDGVFQPNVVRCADDKAEELVSSGNWNYEAKKTWKKHGRKYLGRREI